MTSGQKIFLSLLLSIGLFTGFVLLAETTLFSKIETDFYAQAKIAESEQLLNTKADGYNDYITNILDTLALNKNAYAKSESVATYLMQNPSEADVARRKQQTESLFHTIPSLEGLRLLDKNGISVHYSSFDTSDILKITGITKAYKNYQDIIKNTDDFQASLLQHTDKDLTPTLLFDNASDKLVVSIPLCIGDGIYAADFIFYFNLFRIQQDLINKGILASGENPIAISNSNNRATGLIFGVPKQNEKEFINQILQFWNEPKTDSKKYSELKLLSDDSNNEWVVLNSTDNKYFMTSGIYEKSNFELSKEIKLLVEVCVFFTILLLLLLIFSLKQDPINLIRRRIKAIQIEILKDYLEKKETTEWSKILEQINGRKTIFASQVKKSLGKKSKRHEKEIDSFINSSWDEIIHVLTLESGLKPENGISIEDIRKVVEDVLKTTNLNVTAVNTIVNESPAVKKVITEAAKVVDDSEEIVDAAEVVDEAEEIVDAAEVVDDGEVIIDAAEVVDEAEEIVDAAEIVDDGEEIADVAEVVDEAEEIADAPEVVEDGEEIVDAAEVVDEAEEIIDAAEIVDDGGEVVDAAEVVDEAEEIVDVAEVVEDGEEIADVAEVVDEAEEIADAPEVVDDGEVIADAPEVVDDGVEIADVAKVVDEAEKIAEAAEVIDEAEEIVDAPEVVDDGEEVADVAEVIDEVETVSESEELLDEIENTEEIIDTVEFIDDIEEISDADEISEIENINEFQQTIYDLQNDNLSRAAEEDEKKIFIETENDDFPTLDNILGEELCIGGKYILAKSDTTPFIQFDVSELKFTHDNIEETENDTVINSEKIDTTDELTELDEAGTFSLTSFGQEDNYISELESASPENIIETDGVYSISSDIKMTDVLIDPDFKELVDSICH